MKLLPGTKAKATGPSTGGLALTASISRARRRAKALLSAIASRRCSSASPSFGLPTPPTGDVYGEDRMQRRDRLLESNVRHQPRVDRVRKRSDAGLRPRR